MADQEQPMTVNIVTPDGVVYNHHAEVIVASAIDGDIGIMRGHEPIIAPLKIAEVRVKRVDNPNHEDCIAVNGGFLEFSNDLVSIVANSAERARDIDLRRAKYQKEQAEQTIQTARDGNNVDDLDRAEVSLRKAINRINVSEHK
ncbi:F0F1 ATP synthase subunit epsilon [Companilactobacillus sp.]|jgi:F-type H+-transporting ATPase subunit epsilon|uniref:F0F1 ATP synthase subunit epsilon n=1 Tax=Companilactobacillus sp. TaxID=2767905 RepID=UPI0025C22664|nr:F0F1 ATP synthase subunit epsilon [Companilactobacillus sp.]MCH4008479.1 F0F1 ATP synthase subunit epsilon [Companilactobacillus sp.]MCH4051342.1 F0F1 ATP synthase subunit epsilon [Companilactobacillus sp.]MCH4076422.1 F0F1 ATP synthase subunit epsilon [Companilactobacillus sp.]MCH4124997.1 F0F1 ATP synthase subunit epsilon [Companilactobacillus sp.]MCH4131539.1 F0F1 ATP synthase subunit epsilon [Companilactobacillus sp.]